MKISHNLPGFYRNLSSEAIWSTSAYQLVEKLLLLTTADKLYKKPVMTWPNLTCKKKSRIRETKNLSTDADSRTDTIFKRLHDLSEEEK